MNSYFPKLIDIKDGFMINKKDINYKNFNFELKTKLLYKRFKGIIKR